MYNGHKNWNHWNVSLWLFNDEGLYSLMRRHVALFDTRDKAAKQLVGALHAAYGDKTPDGAPYTFTSVRAALKGWES